MTLKEFLDSVNVYIQLDDKNKKFAEGLIRGLYIAEQMQQAREQANKNA